MEKGNPTYMSNH